MNRRKVRFVANQAKTLPGDYFKYRKDRKEHKQKRNSPERDGKQEGASVISKWGGGEERGL